jgi:hypothetical protein
MKFTRAAFGAGIAVGFIAGSRAGREQYDRMVKYSRMAVNSPPVQRAGHAISAKATDLAKSAGAKASKTADDAGKKARDRAAKVKVPKTPKMPRTAGRLGKSGWRSRTANPEVPPSVGTQPSANGGRKAPTTHND